MKPSESLRVGLSSLWNRTKGWPVCVSFEVTHSCCADCHHCDKGGLKSEAVLMTPADYRWYSAELKAAVCQVSGGEPLLREDLVDIVRALKRSNGLPWIVLVSNWWLMTEKKYLALNRAGVSLFSISLDFPDKRHDEFREIPGLYAHMNEIVPYLVRKYGRGNIVMNSALTHANFTEIPGLVEQAEQWGTPISFSAYSALRTGDLSLCINRCEDLAVLRQHLDYLKEHRRRSPVVLNSDWILEQTYRFFAEGGMKDCEAGRRFIVVRPDGLLNACSMFPDLKYQTRKEAVRGFRATRQSCDQCYVAIRASTERGLWRLIEDNLRVVGNAPGIAVED